MMARLDEGAAVMAVKMNAISSHRKWCQNVGSAVSGATGHTVNANGKRAMPQDPIARTGYGSGSGSSLIVLLSG